MIKNYLRLVITDIKMNIKYYILLMVQSVIALIVIGNICNEVSYTNSFVNSLDSFNFSDNYYGAISNEIYTGNGIMVSEEDIKLKNMLSYYIGENFHTEGYGIADITKNEEIYSIFYVSENFFDIYGLKLLQGRFFEKSEYNVDSLQKTPVILGADYAEQYKLGDIFLDDYEIVGFLEKNSKIAIIAGEGSSVTSIDYCILAPVKSMKAMKENNYGYPTTLIYSENKSDLKKINDYANEIGIYTSNFTSLNEAKTMVNIIGNKVNIPLIVISSIIILLALLCLIQSMLEFVKKNIVELLIHMMCGARLSDIILRVGAGTALTAFISAAAAALIFRSASTTAVLFITAAAVTVIAVLPVAVRLKLKPLIVAVKEEK